MQTVSQAALVLIRCQMRKCREPLGRFRAGSSGEVKCPKCGVKTPINT